MSKLFFRSMILLHMFLFTLFVKYWEIANAGF